MSARSWVLPLPYSKPPLSLNDRRHHMVVYRLRRGVRDNVRTLARAHHIPRLYGIHVELHYLPARAGVRDEDNAVATLKPAIDGLRDYPQRRHRDGRIEPAWTGVVADDDPTHVTWNRPIIHPPAKQHLGPRVWLVITEGTLP